MNQRGGRLPRGGGLQNDDVVHDGAVISDGSWERLPIRISNMTRQPRLSGIFNTR